MDGFTTKKFYPLRPIQRWLVDTHFNKAKSTMMNIGGLFKLSAKIDLQRFVDAINEVLNAHDIFSCRFVFHPETSDLCQIFDGEIEPVKIIRMNDEAFNSHMEKLREPYRIINKPLWRIYVIETPTARYFYADFYHAIMDGVASSILCLREIEKIYRGRTVNRPALSYAEYVDEEAHISPAELAEAHDYWRKMLAPFDKSKHLPPVDVEGVAAWTQGNFEYTFKNFTEEFFRNTGRSENTFLLAATMMTLAKVTRSNEAIMSWIHNGRTNMRERRLMGLMLEQFPCAWKFDEDITVGDFLNQLEGQIRQGTKYRKGLDMVYNDGLEDDCVSFIFQKGINNDPIFCDTTMETIYLPPNEISAVENALDVEVEAQDDGTYDVFLDYDASRYSEASIENFAKIMNKILVAMRDVDTRVSAILA